MTASLDSCAAILLAAGAGTRFTSQKHKLLAELRGAPVYMHALRSVVDAGFNRIIVVTGAVSLDLPDEVTRVQNDDWESGQLSSLRAGLAAADGAEIAVIGLADQPFVTPEAWRTVAASTESISVATYEGQRAHPVGLAARLWTDALAACTEPDEGLRTFMRLHPELVKEVPCKGSPIDIDTPEDLEKWN